MAAKVQVVGFAVNLPVRSCLQHLIRWLTASASKLLT